ELRDHPLLLPRYPPLLFWPGTATPQRLCHLLLHHTGGAESIESDQRMAAAFMSPNPAKSDG
ncbi:unnamed protein product, partial [Urochloa humidicola]